MQRSKLFRLFLGWSLVVWLVSGAVAASSGSLTISEFLARNDRVLDDEDGDSSDWIEIRNDSEAVASLQGYFLTDDPLDLTKWQFPNVGLAAGETLIVFASNKDRIDPARILHTNFRLGSAVGGYLALVEPDGATLACVYEDYPEQFEDISYGLQQRAASSEILVAEGDNARYLVPSGEVVGWNVLSFDDSTWAESTTGIGYADSSSFLAPFLGSGTNEVRTAMEGNNSSAYIRIPFNASNVSELEDLILSLRWDDGFVAYLNGEEIHRENAPENVFWNSEFVERFRSRRIEHYENNLHPYPFEAGMLVEGENILAIQGLNSSSTSDDFLISPQLSATRVQGVASEIGFFPTPSPGEGNTSLLHDEVLFRPDFSVTRGTYFDSFPVELSTANLAAEIYYTLDGSEPSAENGILYNGPISISQTTALRAVTYKNGFLSDIETHTFFFPAATNIAPTFSDSLQSLPVISLNSSASDVDYIEVPMSVELLNFESGDFQLDAGGARFGQFFTDFSKRGIRLQFRSRYGPRRLRFPLFNHRSFPIAPVDSFDSLDLRAGNHDRVQRGAYVANRYTDDATMEMGHVAPHGRFVHVFFNGEYRGQYHLRERWGAAMLADYLPGEEEEYDTINANNAGSEFLTGLLQDGDLNEWDELQDHLAGPTPFASSRDLLDIPNLIDFMLLWTSGDAESEFRAGGSSSNGEGFKFFIKDADGFVRTRDYPVTHNGPLDAMTELRNEADPDFRTLLGDRIHKHFFNDGALTPARNIARLEDVRDQMRDSYPAEFARWPSDRSLHRNPTDWLAYFDPFINSHFLSLSDNRVSAYRVANMYPDLEAPSYSQHGGFLAGGTLSISVPNSVQKIYYVTGPEDLDPSIYQNSLDPRLPGGTAINALANVVEFEGESDLLPRDLIITGDSWRFLNDGSNQGTAWQFLTYNDSGWNVGVSPLGFGDPGFGTNISNNGFITTYFRRTFDVVDPSQIEFLRLRFQRDDGIAIYLNGVEVARDNLPVAATSNTFADSAIGRNNETVFLEEILDPNLLNPGQNVIAVEVHQASLTSSDLRFNLELLDDFVAPENSFQITLDEPGWVLARSFDEVTGEWSALNEAFFSLTTTPADASNLVVSKIHYNPADPSESERLIADNADEYEFIELMNVGIESIDLSGVTISGGITFTFGTNQFLDAGERIVVVENEAAFSFRYASLPEAITLASDGTGSAEYGGKLSNGGENLILTAAQGGVIQNFTYQDDSPWPTVSDGLGYSLVLKNPRQPVPNHNIGTNWAASAEVGGSPGDESNFGFVGAPFVDGDKDGLDALLEYATASSDSIAGDNTIQAGVEFFSEGLEGDDYLQISYDLNQHAQNAVAVIPEISNDLETWRSLPDLILISEVNNGDGTSTLVYRSRFAVGEAPQGKEFIRVMAVELP